MCSAFLKPQDENTPMVAREHAESDHEEKQGSPTRAGKEDEA